MKFQYQHPKDSETILIIRGEEPAEQRELDFIEPFHIGTNWDECLETICKDLEPNVIRKLPHKTADHLVNGLNALFTLLQDEPDSKFWKDTGVDIMMDTAGITEHLVKALFDPEYYGKTHKLTTTLYRLSENNDHLGDPRYDKIMLPPDMSRWCNLTITVKLSSIHEDEDGESKRVLKNVAKVKPVKVKPVLDDDDGGDWDDEDDD